MSPWGNTRKSAKALEYRSPPGTSGDGAGAGHQAGTMASHPYSGATHGKAGATRGRSVRSVRRSGLKSGNTNPAQNYAHSVYWYKDGLQGRADRIPESARYLPGYANPQPKRRHPELYKWTRPIGKLLVLALRILGYLVPWWDW